MKQVRKIAGVVATSALLFAGSVVADGRQDFYSQTSQVNYFSSPETARIVGMAGSSVATTSDSSSVTGNPAGLGFMKDAEVSGTYAHNEISGNDEADYGNIHEKFDGGSVLGSVPIVPTLDGTPKYGSVGFGWTGFRGDANDDANSDSRNYSLNLAYGKDLSDRLALGYAVAYNHDRIHGFVPGASDSGISDLGGHHYIIEGVSQDLGAQYKLSRATTLGASSHYAFDAKNSGDYNNWGADVGIGHTIGQTLLTGSVDYNLYNNNNDDFGAWGFRAGVEQTLTNWLKARLGYRYTAIIGDDLGYGNDNSKYNAVAFGVGVKLAKYLMADYGAEYRASGDGDWLHTVTLSVPFSLCNN